MINRKPDSFISKKTFGNHKWFYRIALCIHKQYLKKQLPATLVLIIITFSGVFSQNDGFSKEEADHFRSQKIFPLIAREQDGDYPRSTYLIPHDITVPKGKVLTFYPGSTLLFKKDTRLIVFGKLIAKGKNLNPVIFCNLDNRDYYTPVDSMVDTKWDGIFISDSGIIELQYTHVSDSKYGLVVEEPLGEVILDSVQFYNNRYQNLKVGANEISVKEATNFFYQFTAFSKPALITTLSLPPDTQSTPQLITVPELQRSPKVRVIRIITTAGMILGAAAGGGGYYLHKKYYSDYTKIELPTEHTNDSDRQDRINKANKYHKLSMLGEGLRNSGISIAGLCLTGFTISLFY